MAYAAVISLKQTINDLLNSSRIFLFSSSREIIKFAYNETTSLQQVLERFNDSSKSSSKKLDYLDGQIRDCAHELEDVLEFYESDHQLYSHKSYEDEGAPSLTLFLEVRQQITSFAESVKKMGADYIEELSSQVPEDDGDDDDDDASSNMDFGVEMVGRSAEVTKIQNGLLQKMRPIDTCVYSFVGEVGTGRTIGVRAIFKDLRKAGEQQCFDCGAWVTIGTRYELKEVAIRILAQVDNLAAGDYELLLSRDDEKILDHLYKTLEHRRYMIVLDDVRDVQLFDYLRKSFPQQSSGSLVFLVTTLMEVAESADSHYIYEPPVEFIEEYSWIFLLSGILGEDDPEFNAAAKKIAENCGGRRISIAKTLLFLYKAEKTPEQWRKIAADKDNPIFMVGDEMSEIREIETEMQSYNCVPQEDDKESITEFVSKFTDFSDYISGLKRAMYPKTLFYGMLIISFFGMAGIGKTKFVKKVFKDKSILCHFDCRAWITLGPKYQAKEILIDILSQMYPSIDKMRIRGDEKVKRDLCAQLSCKRCLIVFDDLRSKEPLLHLKNIFPDIKGNALVTTRIGEAARFGEDDIAYSLQLLNKEESWCLLHEKVFGKALCTPELEKVGRKIAEKCEGLPLLILTVAEQLLKVEMTAEFWNNVASGKQKSVFMNAHEKISKALLPSYKSLPQHLKACFLYMGVFCEQYEIPKSKLTNLCIAERFLEPNPPHIVEDFVVECLSELLQRSLVMVQFKISDFQMKTCRLHSVFWHLSNSVAVKNSFFHAMNSYADCSIECIKSQRRLCIRNSILLGMTNVRSSIASMKSTHSLLCVSLPHQYPVSINFGLRLLRVMDAHTIRLYEFPVEVVKLVHLRYLGLTCNGKLPTSISKLGKLQHLIVSRHMNIKSSENDYSLLPVEIWDMKELKHLQIMGGCLPNPKCGAGLRKLSTLLDVSAQSCTKKVLKRIPNLKRLGIRIELAPDDGKGNGNPFHCLNRISRLRRLESLKCVVVNPQIKSKVVPPPPPPPISMFPSNLKKLSLSGFGYPWEHTSIIGELGNLEVLKLKRYAFRGPKWKVDYTCPFAKLKFLLVEDSDLVHWESTSGSFPLLQRLGIKHCYKLVELPTFMSTIVPAQIGIIDCNPSLVSWEEQIRKCRKTKVLVHHHFSWVADTHE